MEVTSKNLHVLIAQLRKCSSENKHKQTSTGYVNVANICEDTANYLDKVLAYAKNIDEYNVLKKNTINYE